MGTMGNYVTSKDSQFSLCSNTECASRLACERGYLYDIDTVTQMSSAVDFERNDNGTCDWFMIREKLKDEGSTLRRRSNGGNKHNLHAPGTGYRKRQTPESLGLQPPDLMVSRHIKRGHDIKKEGKE